MGDEFQQDEGKQAPPASTPNPQAPPVSDVVSRAEFQRLEAQYGGLKGHAAQEKARADRLAADYDRVNQEHEGLKASTQATSEKLTKELELERTRAATFEAQVAKLERAQEIGRTVRSAYPQLTALYDEGLLLGVESLEGDALKEHLGKLAEKLKTVTETGVQAALSGSAPSSPQTPAPSSLTEAQLYDALMAAKPGTDAYNTLYAQYMESLTKRK